MTTDSAVVGLDAERVERYLKSLLGKDISLLGLIPLGEPPDQALGKSYGYGTPVPVDDRAENGYLQSAVLHTMSPGPFGHEHMADRAHTLIWSHHAFNRLRRHVRSFDGGGFEPAGNLLSLGKVEEFCLLTEYGEGENCALDLKRLRETCALAGLDLARADALCDYLVGIHGVSLQRSGRLEGAFETLFLRFWERYLDKSANREMLQFVAPFFAFRRLVMASPVWYPSLAESLRRKLLAFILNVLESEAFDPAQVNAYCGA